MESYENTRHTLLDRVCDVSDDEAWDEFVEYYSRFIHHVVRYMGVSESDCDDLVQQILLRLTRSVGTYDRTKAGFRTWLSTVCRNCVYRYYSKQKTQSERFTALTAENEMVLSDEIANDDELEKFINSEWENYITSLAMDRVKDSFRGNAITIFEMSLRGISFSDIAEHLSMTEKSVSVVKRRVYNKLLLEIKDLIHVLEARDAE